MITVFDTPKINHSTTKTITNIKDATIKTTVTKEVAIPGFFNGKKIEYRKTFSDDLSDFEMIRQTIESGAIIYV